MSRIDKPVQTDSRLVVARGWRVRREQNGKRLLNGYGVFFGGDENILEIDSGNGCTTL